MNKTTRKFTRIDIILIIDVILLVAIIFGIFHSFSGFTSSNSNYTVFKGDAKVLSLNTEISIQKEEDFFGTVLGNKEAKRFFSDPLTLKRDNEENIAYAGDSYNLLKCNSHSISVNDYFTYNMIGTFKPFKEHYEIYDNNNNHIANATFSALNLKGQIHDLDGNLLVEYSSNPFKFKFNFKIYDECTIDETSVVMIICSYYSDFSYRTK